MFQLALLKSQRQGSWKKLLNKGSGFFKKMHERKDVMKQKKSNSVKTRKQNLQKEK